MALLLNADLGEIEDSNHRVEKTLMPLIDLANIACGFHAGSPQTIAGTLAIASGHDVRIGAHPGYEDRANFGRISIPHSADDLAHLIHHQTDTLEAIANQHHLEVGYIKPHGALYNDMMITREVRRALLAAVGQRPPPRKLMVLATRDWQEIQHEAEEYGVELIFEAFADRRYDNRGFLLSRQVDGSLLERSQMLDQVQQLQEDGTITSVNGEKLLIVADTLCVHGDTPDAISAILDIRKMISP